MPSAFVLFGELKADTQSFQNSLRESERRLQGTANAITATERQAKSLGVTSAASGRQFDRLNETLAGAQQRLRLTAMGFEQGVASQAQMRTALLAVDRAVAGVSSRLADAGARAQDYSARTQAAADRAASSFSKAQDRMRLAAASAAEAATSSWDKFSANVASAGNGLKAVGTALTVGITAPLAGLAYQSIQSATSLDTLRTRLQAATGSVESANTAFDHLRALAQANAGVMTAGAVATFAFLRPMGLAAGTIDEVIKAFGKLKSANPEADLQRLGTNLTQLFTQDFERTDLKEMMGTFPRFGEVMQNAFKLPAKDLAGLQVGLKDLKANGLTLEQLFAGFAGGVNTDAFLKNIADPIEVRFAKMRERIMVAIEPIGKIILSVFEKITPTVLRFVEGASAAFTALSPIMQTVLVAFGAIAAAIGPSLIALGALVIATEAVYGAVAAAAAIFGGFAPLLGAVALAVVGITLQLSVLAAGIYVAYQAWQANFGGIRDFTLQAWAAIQAATSAAMAAIYSVTASVGGQIVAWWQQNWPLIQETIHRVSEAIKTTVQAFITTVQGLWEAHGTRLTAIVSAICGFISDIVSGALSVIANLLKLGMQVFNQDWEAAWQTTLAIIQSATKFIVQYIANLQKIIITGLQAIIPLVIQWGVTLAGALATAVGRALTNVVLIFANLPGTIVKLIPKFLAAGLAIGSAIMEGVKQALGFGSPGEISLGANVGGVDTSGVLADLLKGLSTSTAAFTPQLAGLPAATPPPILSPALAAAPALTAATTAGQNIAGAETVLNAISRELEGFRRDFNGKGGSKADRLQIDVKDGTRDGIKTRRLGSPTPEDSSNRYDPFGLFDTGNGLTSF